LRVQELTDRHPPLVADETDVSLALSRWECEGVLARTERGVRRVQLLAREQPRVLIKDDVFAELWIGLRPAEAIELGVATRRHDPHTESRCCRKARSRATNCGADRERSGDERV